VLLNSLVFSSFAGLKDRKDVYLSCEKPRGRSHIQSHSFSQEKIKSIFSICKICSLKNSEDCKGNLAVKNMCLVNFHFEIVCGRERACI